MTDRAPFLRTRDSALRVSLDMLLMLSVLTLMAYIFYGWRPVVLVLVSTACAVLLEAGACLWLRRPLSIKNGTAAITGALIGLLISPLSPYWLPVVGCAFAILIVKMPFGGTGRNLFSPAAAGMALMTVLFPTQTLTFPAPSLSMQPLPLGDVSQVITAPSPSAMWMMGGQLDLSWSEVFLGAFAGPSGTTAVIVIAACLIYLAVRRAARLSTCLSFLAATFIGSLLLWQNASQALMMLLATPVFFAAVFLLPDPVTSPKNTCGRILYGVAAAVFLLLVRSFARYEETVCFAVLLANAFAPALDHLGYRITCRLRKKEDKV